MPKLNRSLRIYMSKNKLTLPCLRARMGDWFYYVTVMQFSDINQRLSMVDEIHNKIIEVIK